MRTTHLTIVTYLYCLLALSGILVVLSIFDGAASIANGSHGEGGHKELLSALANAYEERYAIWYYTVTFTITSFVVYPS